MKNLSVFPLATLALVSAVSGLSAAELNGKPRIIDGDTLEISGQRIRLLGIDAPESKQKCKKNNGLEYHCGTMATFALAELIEEHWVKCVGEENDRYGRLIATCFTGPIDLNENMVRRGWALAYRRYSFRYVPAEGKAKSARRGLWQGTFIKPWDWRSRIRVEIPAPSSAAKIVAGPSDPNCTIKGNISRSGSRIYHLPGGKYYAKTKINTDTGEHWFCSQSDAEQAGWRAAK